MTFTSIGVPACPVVGQYVREGQSGGLVFGIFGCFGFGFDFRFGIIRCILGSSAAGAEAARTAVERLCIFVGRGVGFGLILGIAEVVIYRYFALDRTAVTVPKLGKGQLKLRVSVLRLGENEGGKPAVFD